ncbi:MAG: magnesium chelatase family protein, partial [Paracoccaceae bacterium]
LLMDRFDLRLEVPPVTVEDLGLPDAGDNTAIVAARVKTARAVQSTRFSDVSDCRVNADAEGELLEEISKPDPEGAALLAQAAEKFRLTARGYHRVLRVARTIADLDGSASVKKPHLAEAISFRLMQNSG